VLQYLFSLGFLVYVHFIFGSVVLVNLGFVGVNIKLKLKHSTEAEVASPVQFKLVSFLFSKVQEYFRNFCLFLFTWQLGFASIFWVNIYFTLGLIDLSAGLLKCVYIPSYRY